MATLTLNKKRPPSDEELALIKKKKQIEHQKRVKAEKYASIKKRKEDTAKLFTALKVEYPKLFDVDEPKPIMVFCLEAILEKKSALTVEFSKTKINRGLSKYVRRDKYLHAIIDSDYRYDLEGNQCGKITVRQKERAQKQLHENLNNLSRKTNQ